jgi:hypothetical protein
MCICDDKSQMEVSLINQCPPCACYDWIEIWCRGSWVAYVVANGESPQAGTVQMISVPEDGAYACGLKTCTLLRKSTA